MKKIDLLLIAEFLDRQHQEFAEFLEEEKEIAGVEGDMIIEELLGMIDGLEDASMDAEEELLP